MTTWSGLRTGLDRQLPGVPLHPAPAHGGAGVDFATAYQDHHQAVTAAARRVCGPEHAADVAQDVFASFWRQPLAFDPDRGSLRAFLTSVARHKAVDVVRHEAALRARERRVDASQAPVPGKLDDGLLRDEVAARVREALDALPPREREAIALAYFGGCTYRVTAARLGQPEGTIKSRISSGLRRLRPILADLCAPGWDESDDRTEAAASLGA